MNEKLKRGRAVEEAINDLQDALIDEKAYLKSVGRTDHIRRLVDFDLGELAVLRNHLVKRLKKYRDPRLKRKQLSNQLINPNSKKYVGL